MTQEIEKREVVVGFPLNAGEVIDLADTPKVGTTLRELQDWNEQVYRPIIRELQEAIIRAADERGEWTMRFGAMKVTADGPGAVTREWDQPELMRDELIEAGLPDDRADEVVVAQTTYRVVWAQAKKLMAVPKYAAIIESYMTEVPKVRRASVSGGGRG